MMDYFYHIFSGFVDTLKKSYKIFSTKNGKLIPSITILFLILSSILLLSNILSIKPYILEFAIRLSVTFVSPSSSDFTNLVVPVKSDLQFFAGTEWIFLIASSITSFILATASIISISAEHNGQTLNLKTLLSFLGKTWKRPFVTLFYTTLFDLGYIFFALAYVMPFVIGFVTDPMFQSFFATLALVLVLLMYFYVSIVWTLAIVVSILEEKQGIMAIGKAGEIAEGMMVKGFLLKLLFGSLYYGLLQLLRVISDVRSSGASLFIALVLVNSVCFVKMLSLIAYTVFYDECKRAHGEEVGHEFHYTKTDTNTPLISADHINYIP